MSAEIKFDMNVAIEALKRQRNDALDQCAMATATVTALAAENESLKAALAEKVATDLKAA